MTIRIGKSSSDRPCEVWKVIRFTQNKSTTNTEDGRMCGGISNESCNRREALSRM